jgi:hypothetical protein
VKRATLNVNLSDKLNLNAFLTEEQNNQTELTPLMKHRNLYKQIVIGKKYEPNQLNSNEKQNSNDSTQNNNTNNSNNNNNNDMDNENQKKHKSQPQEA